MNDIWHNINYSTNGEESMKLGLFWNCDHSPFFFKGGNNNYMDSTKRPDFAPLNNVQFVKYDVTVSFMAQVLDTVTYLVPQVLDTAS